MLSHIAPWTLSLEDAVLPFALEDPVVVPRWLPSLQSRQRLEQRSDTQALRDTHSARHARAVLTGCSQTKGVSCEHSGSGWRRPCGKANIVRLVCGDTIGER